MNRLAIELNNMAIEEFKRGDLLMSFGLFSQAADSISTTTTTSTHDSHDADNTPEKEVMYQFSWEDCGKTMTSNNILRTSIFAANIEETIPFLYLNFLRILSLSAEESVAVDSMCPCAFSWGIRYNFGLLCTILGVVIGESGGRMILQQGFELLECVREHAAEQLSRTAEMSCQWRTLLLYVLNNQGFIYRECSMSAQASPHFEMMRQTLDDAVSSDHLNYKDSTGFYLNLQILSTVGAAGAA